MVDGKCRQKIGGHYFEDEDDSDLIPSDIKPK